MKPIEKMIDRIDDELEGAKKYAEMYIEEKAKGNIARANAYKEMSHDELKHASYIHDFATKDVESIGAVFTIPEEADEKWEHAHKHYADCVGRIKHMLE